MNPKNKILRLDSITITWENVKKKFYLDSYEITQIYNNVIIKFLSTNLDEIKVKKPARSEETEILISLNKSFEQLKYEIENRTFIPLITPITPSPLKNLLFNEEKIINLIKENEAEVSDEVSKFFSENILNKKILMGLTVFFTYIFFFVYILYFCYILYIKLFSKNF